ncbi:MAG: hypothetical protein L7U72_12195 [Rubripirellula sp.]|nr:hypothetical protein [Rubripirellula sp.]
MFRFRGKDPESIHWGNLLTLLEDDDQRAAVEMQYPHEQRESFLGALARLDRELHERLLAAGRQFNSVSRLIDWPTVAVAGMLNSGKTSLVASFLSERGRARSLRGTSNAHGTHRFVIWLPSQWREDSELWDLLMERIGDAVGAPPEPLAESAADAHLQYNNHGGDSNTLAVPLVATDPKLNELGIGLLDCPDIVSDEAFGLGSPQLRREVLGRAATLCSAFLVVTSADSTRDGTLGDLLRIASDLMPGVPRMLAVNKVRAQQSPDQVLETFAQLAKSHGIEAVYAAYDFDVPSSAPFIPKVERDAELNSVGDDPLPLFYSLSASPDENPPAVIPEERLLATLPSRLDRGQLFEKFRDALQVGLQTLLWNDAFYELDRDAHQSQKRSSRAQECLLEAAIDFFAQRGLGGEVQELRLHQSERIIRQLSESFAATAPWYARWGVRLNATVRRVFGGAGDLLKQLTPSALARRAAGEVKDKFRRGEFGGLLTAEKLAQSLDRHGASVHLQYWFHSSNHSGQHVKEVDSLLEACEAAILRFERDDFTSLDPSRLDEAVRQMWKEIPTHQKLTAGLTPLAALLATFGGVMMIPIDFGATHLIASASISELLAAAGLTTLSALWAGKQSTRNVGQQAARQQLSDFHAVLCDTFGLKRPAARKPVRVSGLDEPLIEPKIVQREPIQGTLPFYAIRDTFREQLKEHVAKIDRSRR